MLLKIERDQIRVGMFIESVDCSSQEFGRRRFLLTSNEDVEEIKRTSARAVSINLVLGLGAAMRNGEAADGKTSVDSPKTKHPLQICESLNQQALATKKYLTHIVGNGTPDITAMRPLVDGIESTWHDDPVAALQLTRLKRKDATTYIHSMAVSGLMCLLGRSLALEEDVVMQLGVAGLLHDIGKLLVPTKILTKSGELTAEERIIIRDHPQIGFNLLSRHEAISPFILDICRHHHEVLDGSGYPLGLKGDKLELHIRVATVCDVFEALTSVRPYKRPWSTRAAIKWMFERPEFYDSKLVIRLGSLLA